MSRKKQEIYQTFLASLKGGGGCTPSLVKQQTIATLGPTWNPTFIGFLQVFTCKLGHGVVLFPVGDPSTHPPDTYVVEVQRKVLGD